MNIEIQSNLYTDPQDQPPAGFCPECGCELYWPSLVCIRCEGGVL